MQAQRMSENRNAEKLHRTAISRNQTILPPSKKINGRRPFALLNQDPLQKSAVYSNQGNCRFFKNTRRFVKTERRFISFYIFFTTS